MATYAALNLLVLAILGCVMFFWRQRLECKTITVTLTILLALTAVFDSLIIFYDIVAYDTAKLLGVYIWKAPIEDFAYTIAVAVIVPYLWELYDRKD